MGPDTQVKENAIHFMIEKEQQKIGTKVCVSFVKIMHLMYRKIQEGDGRQ